MSLLPEKILLSLRSQAMYDEQLKQFLFPGYDPKKPVPDAYRHTSSLSSPFILKDELPAVMKGLKPYDLGEKIMAMDNILDADTCRKIIAHIEAEHTKKPGVSNNQRTAFFCPLGQEMKDLLKPIFFKALTEIVEPYFGVELEWWEQPQLLRYEKDGKYDAHSDSENIVKGQENMGWQRVHDRDVSILMYLNNDFTGGLLHFPDHNLRIRPKPGLLVAFPSGHEYRHAAEPTESGVRYAIASWAAAKETVRVKPMPNHATLMDEFRKTL